MRGRVPKGAGPTGGDTPIEPAHVYRPPHKRGGVEREISLFLSSPFEGERRKGKSFVFPWGKRTKLFSSSSAQSTDEDEEEGGERGTEGYIS